MAFEISVSRETDARRMTQFTAFEAASGGELAEQCCRAAWSPIIWNGGRRAKVYFSHSHLCALDFDDGRWSVDDAVNALKQRGLAGFIGTTKSHRVSKDGKPATERFRLVLPWDGVITDARTYEQNMSMLVQRLPADKACKDAGRFFWPCKEIVYYQHGTKLEWAPYSVPAPRKPSYSATCASQLKQFPVWMENELAGGISVGSRNRTAFRFAAYLKRLGFNERDVFDGFDGRIDIDKAELGQAISSAFRNT